MKQLRHLACLAALTISTASAQLLYQDSFNYPDGPLLTAPGSPWVNNYPPANEINVAGGQLWLTQTEQESVRFNFPVGYGSTNLFASFKVNFSALPTGGGNYFAFFRAQNTDALFCRLWAATNGAALGKFRLGIRAMSSSAIMIPSDLNLGTTYTLVLQFTRALSTATAKLWINPSSQSDTALRAEDEQTGFGYSVGHFGFKQRAFYESPADGMGDLSVDELKIGFRFADVLPPLRFTAITNLGVGGMKLLGTGLAGTNYSVLATTNLSMTNWINLGTAQAEASGAIQFTDPAANNFRTRFYRLVAQ